MNGGEISAIASNHFHTRYCFGGVYSSDTVPASPQFFPIFYIVNTDILKNRGKHWIFLFLPSAHEPIEWFDSLGFFPFHHSKKLHLYVTKNGSSPFLSNVEAVQSESSTACGHFCLMMGDMRGRGLSYKKSVGMFEIKDLKNNDQMVRRFLEEHMAYQG